MRDNQSIQEAPIEGKRVVVRVDVNVPLHNGAILNDLRIRAIVPTLEFLHSKGAATITLLAHLGRPDGKEVASLTLAPVEARLRELTSVPFVMHKNVRFDAREEANDPVFAAELAALGDLYINEAFADSHRAHASVVGVPALIPGYAGLHMMEEVAHLSAALRPPLGSIAIIGGAKFETKIPLITKLLSLYSEVLLGGALANDVIKARGLPFGSSLVSATPVPMDIATDERLQVPTDAIFSEVGAQAERSGSVVDIRANESIIDIGPVTSADWAKKISNAPFVLWNGPMGMYEQGYTDGTDVLANALVQSGVRAVVGGGDTVAAIEKHTFDPQKVFISTGGGAMLQYIVDGTLPGIEALK